jgi:hypothetical protein
MQKYIDESPEATDLDEIREQIIELEQQYRHH